MPIHRKYAQLRQSSGSVLVYLRSSKSSEFPGQEVDQSPSLNKAYPSANKTARVLKLRSLHDWGQCLDFVTRLLRPSRSALFARSIVRSLSSVVVVVQHFFIVDLLLLFPHPYALLTQQHSSSLRLGRIFILTSHHSIFLHILHSLLSS